MVSGLHPFWTKGTRFARKGAKIPCKSSGVDRRLLLWPESSYRYFASRTNNQVGSCALARGRDLAPYFGCSWALILIAKGRGNEKNYLLVFARTNRRSRRLVSRIWTSHRYRHCPRHDLGQIAIHYHWRRGDPHQQGNRCDSRGQFQ